MAFIWVADPRHSRKGRLNKITTSVCKLKIERRKIACVIELTYKNQSKFQGTFNTEKTPAKFLNSSKETPVNAINFHQRHRNIDTMNMMSNLFS